MHDLWLKRLGRKRGQWIMLIQGALRRWRADVSRGVIGEVAQVSGIQL